MEGEKECPVYQYGVFSWLWSTLSLSGHLLILFVVISKKLCKEPQYFFLANLAVNNSIFSMRTLFNVFINKYALNDANKVIFAKINTTVGIFLWRGMLTWTNILTWNRYVAITRCLRYQLIMKRPRVVKIAIGAWILPAVLELVQKMEDIFTTPTIVLCTYESRILIPIITFIMILMTVTVSISTSYVVHAHAKRQYKKITSQVKSLYGEFGETIHNLDKQRKKTNGIFVMACMFNVFFVPVACINIKHILERESMDQKYLLVSTGFLVTYVTLSPFLYIVSLTQLKEAIVSLFDSMRQNKIFVAHPGTKTTATIDERCVYKIDSSNNYHRSQCPTNLAEMNV